MAASTTTQPAANSEHFLRKLKALVRSRLDRNLKPTGSFMFDTGSITITNFNEQDDKILALQFPDNCLIEDLFATVSDLDTNGAPAVVLHVISQTTGGAETNLIASSTIGQGSGTDALDESKKYTDVSNQYLGIKVATAPATAAASGTLRLQGKVIVGASGSGYVSIN